MWGGGLSRTFGEASSKKIGADRGQVAQAAVTAGPAMRSLCAPARGYGLAAMAGVGPRDPDSTAGAPGCRCLGFRAVFLFDDGFGLDAVQQLGKGGLDVLADVTGHHQQE